MNLYVLNSIEEEKRKEKYKNGYSEEEEKQAKWV